MVCHHPEKPISPIHAGSIHRSALSYTQTMKTLCLCEQIVYTHIEKSGKFFIQCLRVRRVDILHKKFFSVFQVLPASLKRHVVRYKQIKLLNDYLSLLCRYYVWIIKYIIYVENCV